MRRANNCEIMLTKIKMPLSDMIVSIYNLIFNRFFVIENSAELKLRVLRFSVIWHFLDDDLHNRTKCKLCLLLFD